MTFLLGAMTIVFQSTHPARGATIHAVLLGQLCVISIHAPREGCDKLLIDPPLPGGAISIHAPREGCDASPSAMAPLVSAFQSTHPARGATRRARSPAAPAPISIHAPREGCDGSKGGYAALSPDFNPRTPRGVRRACDGIGTGRRGISIHAPREGCDLTRLYFRPEELRNFNPRTPRGVRLVGGAVLSHGQAISIHAPREGCDFDQNLTVQTNVRFQSTHPARGATRSSLESVRASRGHFNPRTPRGVRHVIHRLGVGGFPNFNPRTPRGVRHVIHRLGVGGFPNFNPRTPRGVRL